MKKIFFYLIILLTFSFLFFLSLDAAPVVVYGDTLFNINRHSGSFTTEERAENIANKITPLCKNYRYSVDKLVVSEDDNGYTIMYEDVVILGIYPSDAQLEGKKADVLANEIRDIIAHKIQKYKTEHSLNSLLRQIGLALLTIAIAYFIIRLISALFNGIGDKIALLQYPQIKGISIKSYNLLNPSQEQRIILLFIRFFKYFAFVIVIYFALTISFSIFPDTQHIAGKLLGYILTPIKNIYHKIIAYIPTLIKIIVIIVVFRYVLYFLKFLAKEIRLEKIHIKGFYADWAKPTYNIVRILLLVFMVIIIFPLLPGSESSIFRGISIFMGLILSLGSTNLIGNMVAGLVLTYMRPFQIGDMIKIGDVLGNVIEKTPFVVRVRTQKKEEITIPNSTILSSHTTNYTSSANRTKVIIYSTIRVSYDKNWEDVHRLLLQAADKTALILKEPRPFVLQDKLKEFFVEYQINAYIEQVDYLSKIYSDLYQNILDEFNTANIELVSPQYLYNRDSNSQAIPDK